MKTFISIHSGYMPEISAELESVSAIKFEKVLVAAGQISYQNPVAILSYGPLSKESPRSLDVSFEAVIRLHEENEWWHSIIECGRSRFYLGCGCYEETTVAHSGEQVPLDYRYAIPCPSCELGTRLGSSVFLQRYFCRIHDSVDHEGNYINAEDFLGEKYSYLVEKVDLNYRAVNR